MKTWTEHTCFAALDWAKDHHNVIVVDSHGRLLADFRFDHTAGGWTEFAEKMAAFPQCPLALETKSGPAVDQLLQRSFTLYPVNPKSAQRYRDRKLPSGTKTDRFDAWALADALRTDGQAWRPLAPADPLLSQLRALCRDEIALVEQRTALVNQLQQALSEYYPAALEAFDDWTQPYTWAFLRAFPTPEALARSSRRKQENFLHAHSLWRAQTHERRLAVFARADQFCGSPSVVAAKSLLAVSLVAILQTLQRQLNLYRQRIEQLFDSHPDHGLFDSLPGAGPKLAPRLLSELGDDRSVFPDSDALQCDAGTAPASFQTGQIHRTKLRHACNDVLRATVHLWADLSRKRCPWAQTYYQVHRANGQSHACALRCLGKRWLKILWKMWQTRSPYDPELHQRNQLAHGSWVIQMLPPSPQPSPL